LSGITDEAPRTHLMSNFLHLSTLLMVPIVTAVIVLKPLVISMLYSSEFYPSLNMMRWMLLGDYFKVAAWVVAMPVLAYANMKVYFWTESLWNVGLLGFVLLATQQIHSLEWIGIGFLLLYVALLAFYLYYSRVKYHFIVPRRLAISWLLGLLLVIGASWQTWNAQQVMWLSALAWILAASAFSWLALTAHERSRVRSMVARFVMPKRATAGP
jgi:hypothetical protein